MTIRCLFLGCNWQTAVRYQGRDPLVSQVCARCGAHRTVSA